LSARKTGKADARTDAPPDTGDRDAGHVGSGDSDVNSRARENGKDCSNQKPQRSLNGGGVGTALTEDPMTDLSFMLSRAVARGRADRGVPKSRQTILLGLLNKRAEAHRQGLHGQERMLREQIRWALPVNEPEED
jgi:hypothetical protein